MIYRSDAVFGVSIFFGCFVLLTFGKLILKDTSTVYGYTGGTQIRRVFLLVENYQTTPISLLFFCSIFGLVCLLVFRANNYVRYVNSGSCLVSGLRYMHCAIESIFCFYSWTIFIGMDSSAHHFRWSAGDGETVIRKMFYRVRAFRMIAWLSCFYLRKGWCEKTENVELA